MYNKSLIVLLISVFLFQYSNSQDSITVEKIWKSWEFNSASPQGFNFLDNGEEYTRLNNNKVVSYDIETAESSDTLFDGANYDLPVKKYDILKENNMLISSQIESIYRRSTRERYHFYNASADSISRIANGSQVMYATPDPQMNRIAFVNKNNIYLQDLATNEIKAITNDGEKNKIINGASDWVYEEEFSLTRAFEWSPDGKYIAYIKFDESQVPLFQMKKYNSTEYPSIYKFKYPKVGEKNSEVSVHIYNTATNQLRDLKLDNAYYIPRIKWDPDGNLIITAINRHQNDLNLLKINPVKSDIDTLLHEKSDTYININDAFRYIKNGKQFIWQSERNDYRQLFLYSSDGEFIRNLTPNEYDVTSFYGYDEKRGEVVYQAASNSPLNREILAVDIETSDKRYIEDQIGTNSASFSPTFDYYSHTFQTANNPPIYTLKQNDGEVIKALEKNNRLNNAMEEYSVSDVEFFKVKSAGSDSLNAWMIKPPNFDPNKEYPLFMYVYGGPGSQTVTNSWYGKNYWWFQMLADKGVIVVSVDNRGTGARGVEFRKQTYLELGNKETADQIKAAEQLRSRDYINNDKIGIFGWSYGGFMSSNSILQGNDLFTLAIAVAPVTHWKWYDTIYTERYMRTDDENESGYEENSPINFADQLKGDYLIVHGMADDNVHLQNTVEMTEALIRADKQFDTYFYPNRAHGIVGNNARKHLYTKMTNFILENYKIN